MIKLKRNQNIFLFVSGRQVDPKEGGRKVHFEIKVRLGMMRRGYNCNLTYKVYKG